MVNLVNLETVGKAHGTTVLLDGVSLGVSSGDRVGVVGRNGGGKTTLISILTKVEPVDSGRVTHAGGLRVGVLTQAVTLPRGATVRDIVLGETAVHEWAGDARVRLVLDGLGLTSLGLDTVVDPLSGGERRRVALAALLTSEIDLLVLDEPTNHLDVEGVDWLARHLVSRPSSTGLVVVTHDRWFLDTVTTSTWEVADGSVHAYEGGYSAYVLARAERERVAAFSEARRQNLLRKELAWLRRGPPARTSKPRFRIDAANALIADEPPPRDDVQLRRFASARLGKTVYELEDVSLTLGQRELMRDLTWRLGPGDRIGVVGVNGAGKSTLLRLLVGEREPSSGRVVRGSTVKPAYLSQEVVELDPELRVLQSVEEIARSVDIGGGRQLTAGQLLEQLGFPASRQWTRVGELSGGERRRLQLLRLLMAEPNVLLLDEPTNDLDLDTLNGLEDLLDGWPGTLVVVSHDRYFVERVCSDVVALLGDGGLRHLPGGIEEYLERRGAQVEAEAAVAAPRRRTGDSRAARKELTRLERLLERLTVKEAGLHAAMATQAADYAAVAVLDEQLRGLAAERAEAEEQWLELAEAVED